MSKNGVKLMFALLALTGGMALSGCGKTETTISETPTSYVEPSTETPTTEVPSTETPTTEVPGTVTPADNTEKLLQFESDIENLLKNKLNFRLGTEDVKNVDANYFVPVSDFGYGNAIQTEAKITFANNQTSNAVLGLPTTTKQFEDFKTLGFEIYSSEKTMAEQYNLEQMQYLFDTFSNKDLTFSFAFKDDEKWDLDAVSSQKLEVELEEIFTQITQKYFSDNYRDPRVQNIDLKTIKLENNSRMGDYFVLSGNAEYIKNGNVVNYSVTLTTNDDNYSILQSKFDNFGDDQKDMFENYTENQISTIINVCKDETTYIRSFHVESKDFTVNQSINDEQVF